LQVKLAQTADLLNKQTTTLTHEQERANLLSQRTRALDQELLTARSEKASLNREMEILVLENKRLQR